jgi:hypothetical protein
MLFNALLPLLPLTLAAPTTNTPINELSTSQWHSIQSGFAKLTDWSWATAQDVVDALEDEVKDVMTTADDGLTIWQQLKADPHSFSRLVKIIEVSKDGVQYDRG